MLKLLTIILFITSVLSEPPRKHNAGLPSEFFDHRIPEPQKKIEKSAYFRLHFTEGEAMQGNDLLKKVVFDMEVPVNELAALKFALATNVKGLVVTLVSPSGKNIPLDNLVVKEKMPLGDGLSAPISTYVINDITEIGFYALKIETSSFLIPSQRNKILSSNTPNGILILYNEDLIEIETSLTSYMMKKGNHVGLYAQIVQDGVRMSVNRNGIVISGADMLVEDPKGTEIDVPMHDDGKGIDKIPDDSIFSAEIATIEPGAYHLYAILKGYFIDENGNKRPFIKSAEHSFFVTDSNFEINGNALLAPVDAERANIKIGLTVGSGTLGKYRAYTEVYGMKDNVVTPAAWIGSMVNVNDDQTVTLEFNLKWLALSGLKGPLYLKNTYIADAQTSFPITRFDDVIEVKNSELINRYYQNILSMKQVEITKEMKYGVNPLRGYKLNATGPSLIMLHGYCQTVDNPWKKNQHNFENAAYFLNLESNIGNDDFAILVDKFASSQGTDQYSLIGHSQGGMVSMHMATHYWTGLDNMLNSNSEGRPIQAVGTPWKGNTVAGCLADIGKIIGIGCGSNFDLTVDGAALWLAGMNKEMAKHIFYYTTTYELGTWFGDWCNMAVNLIIKWPNDGITEIFYAHLPGGNYCGNTEKQCHSTEMAYNPQYWDNARNAEMNAKVAR